MIKTKCRRCDKELESSSKEYPYEKNIYCLPCYGVMDIRENEEEEIKHGFIMPGYQGPAGWGGVI